MFALGGSNMEDGKGAWFVANNKTLESYRQRSAEDVVRKLWAMYFEGEPRSLVRFERVLRGVIKFHIAWTAIK